MKKTYIDNRHEIFWPELTCEEYEAMWIKNIIEAYKRDKGIK